MARPTKAQFGPTFTASRTPMLLADDDRRFTDANDAAVALLATTRTEILERRIDDLAAPALRDAVPAMWEQFIADGTMTGEFELLRPDGETVWVQFNATANVADGQHLTIFIRHSDLAGLPAQQRRAHAADALSQREHQVLRLIALGYSGGEIADQLGISHSTVRVHARNAMHKLGAKTRAQAIGIAISNGDI